MKSFMKNILIGSATLFSASVFAQNKVALGVDLAAAPEFKATITALKDSNQYQIDYTRNRIDTLSQGVIRTRDEKVTLVVHDNQDGVLEAHEVKSIGMSMNDSFDNLPENFQAFLDAHTLTRPADLRSLPRRAAPHLPKENKLFDPQ